MVKLQMKMSLVLSGPIRQGSVLVFSLLAGWMGSTLAEANPTGATVVQGTAALNTSGPQLTINTSSSTFINWQSFNIAAGETTTFVQPSSTSVAWNQINGASPSQILGNLNANGFVVLQNQAGFYIGGQATIATHGLIMTTAPTPTMPDIADGGAWQFNAPPPTAKIINYGQINIDGGGPAFLIANDIENNGTISAPSGKIGLYAGEQVLVSTSPDGRGLSAQVTLPQGSVDNEGNLIADAGAIAAQAKTVNQDGLIQANSVQNVNGNIELVASDSVNLGAGSVISANGDTTAKTASPGGFVVLKSGNSYADTPTSTIKVSGQSGGQDGIVEIFGAGTVQSSIGNCFALLVNPYDLTLSSNPTDTSSSSPNINVADLANYSQIDLHALDNIELSTSWYLGNPNTPGKLSLTAGNNVLFDEGSGIDVVNNGWSVSLTAGGSYAGTTKPNPGTEGIYLADDAFIYGSDGDIDLWAANEVIVAGGEYGSIVTYGGGNINVTAQYGDVNTGNNVNGYDFGQSTAPYYTVDYFLGGISTWAGGNVTINAGGNVTSFLPVQTGNPNDYLNAQNDAGAGAFGPEPGNVTINAGGNVYGHYVVANGVGTITAQGNVGAPVPVLANIPGEGFALSLVKGSWSVYAPNGSIYVQDVRNPNGIFGEYAGSSAANYSGYHYFDYDPLASVLLDAGDAVEITGYEAPHTPPSVPGSSIPLIFPPALDVITGSGGFILDTSVILFPSPDQSLNITTQNGGNFGIPNSLDPYSDSPVTLEMSDSGSSRWLSPGSFGTSDNSTTLANPLNPNLNNISISGNMNGVNLYVTEATAITVQGNMINSGFVGQNLRSSDVTSINVGGEIYNSPIYSFVQLGSKITSANPLQPSVWDSFFDLAVNPALVASLATLNANDVGPNGLAYYLKQHHYLLFPSSTSSSSTYGSNPGFIYDPSTLELGFQGKMSALSQSQIVALEGGTFTVLVANGQGNPIINANGNLETMTYNFSGASTIATLYTESLNSVLTAGLGLQIGGPGHFTVHAASIDLGNSSGIGSDGFGGSGISGGGYSYSSLQTLLPIAGEGGAAISVNVDDNLSMATSAIYSRDGGNVTVNAGGEIDLSQGNFVFQTDTCYGIYTSGHSDVSVTADGNINIGSSRIASFNGGNVFVESYDGDVNAGSGANLALIVYGVYDDPVTGLPTQVGFGDLTDAASLALNPAPYGSGVLAEYPTKKYQTPGGNGQPGNITILTPQGNIVSSLGGIAQFALDQTVFGGPTVTLSAGTPGIAATDSQGNIDIEDGAIIGGTVNLSSTGNTHALVESKQNANISAEGGFSGGVLAGGTANFSGSSSVSGTVIGIGGINTGGADTGGATLLSQNVVGSGGVSQSTLSSGTATAASQDAAGQNSNEAKQEVASPDAETEDEMKKKKHPVLAHIKRVTVIIPKAG